MNCPPIIVYVSHDVQPRDEAGMKAAGHHMKYAAAMVPRKAGKQAEPGTSWMATGATPEEARAKLEAVWAREHPVRTGPPKRGAKAVEAVDDFIVL